MYVTLEQYLSSLLHLSVFQNILMLKNMLVVSEFLLLIVDLFYMTCADLLIYLWRSYEYSYISFWGSYLFLGKFQKIKSLNNNVSENLNLSKATKLFFSEDLL